ncbi:RNA polymerase sigma-70 factor [Chitinophaga horti]|uniref:RNA polymerase sigma-70 factor n=1 Tax=Chitinophaga horti TaxID=2920382 RepID=A0ABY6JB38_9BACT|nr:RNA polymerase sigma-70 factor [Chitinophaga horti]UYQ95394.1 RNA polymerase sigma-70 factor [Chitinophaga horti]
MEMKDDIFPLNRLKAGDVTAFNLLFAQFYAPLCYFAEKLIGDRFAAEEVVQGVMMTVWDKRADFPAFPALKSFLYVSARNASLNQLDKMQRQRQQQEALVNVVPVSEEVILSAIFKAEAMREIYQAIDQLPEKYRRIMELAYKEELTVNEIAAKLSMPINTVHKQKMRALLSLRKHLSYRSFTLLLAVLQVS